MIDRKFLEANHASLVAELLAEGRDAGHDAGFSAGALAERERIQSVFAQSMPGHSKLIHALAFDGKTSGPEAAAQVLAAERTKLGKQVEDLAADAADLATVAPTASSDPAAQAAAAAAELAKKPIEERCKIEWDKSVELRAEYGDQFDAFVAFRKAEARGNVKILGATKKAA